MRILTIGNMYPPQQLGGAELVWQSWVEHARGLGHDVHVLTSDVALPGAVLTEASERGVERSLRWYWRDHEFPVLSARERLAMERANGRTLKRSLREVDPDVVVWWAMAGMSFSLVERVRRRGLPSVAVLGDYWLQYGPDVDGWMRAFKSRPRLGRVVDRATGLPTRVLLGRDMSYVFVSETVRGRAREAFPDLTDDEVAHHGPDLDLFRWAGERPPWRWRLLYLGRIDERKGVAIAIRALKDLPDEATLDVVGSGDDAHLDDLRALAADQGLADRVRFVARRPRTELPAVMAEADALIFPVTWGEPWGLVPSEAMAVGLPVIGSGRGGSGEYMHHGVNSLLFDPDAGPSDLAARVRELAADPSLRTRLTAAARQTVTALAEESFDDAVQQAVERVVRQRVK
ncbi:radical SAM domain-containing protein [Paraconexibacter sp. AEG42_29]|uniref:Radical SAM domain-containing protein n=1 Tax=Paraconexibacter sp. AEG42_29 TaxID=2997339 RepID=A0AAU7AVY7_9ACTN